MVCVPARAGSDKFLPASSHPLEERAHLRGHLLSRGASASYFFFFFSLLLFFSHPNR
jgi:hypothetical protein